MISLESLVLVLCQDSSCDKKGSEKEFIWLRKFIVSSRNKTAIVSVGHQAQ